MGLCGLYGVLIAAAEALFSISYGVFDMESGRPFSWWVKALLNPLTEVSVRDNLVSLPVVGWALFPAALVAVGLRDGRGSLQNQERKRMQAVVLAVSGLALLEGWFHLRWWYSPGVMGAPEEIHWGVIILGLAGSLDFILYQWFRFAEPDRPGLWFRLGMLVSWMVGGLVVVDSAHQFWGYLALTVWAGLAAGIAVAAWLGYRLCLACGRKLTGGARARAVLAQVLAGAAAAAFAYAFYYEGWGYRSLPEPAQPRVPGPNLVMLVLDTVRADHLSCYGYFRTTTPALDELARQGARFARAYTAAPWTLPSHASFFTGLYPSEHGCESGHPFLDDKYETLAEALRRRGYTTLGFSANPWICHATGLDQGFDRFIQVRLRFEKSRMLGQGVWRWLLGLASPQSLALDNGARQANTLCAKWLQALARRPRPFFLFVNYMEAHFPYPAHPDTYRFFPNPARAGQDYAAVDFDWIRHDAGARAWSASDLDLVRAKYDGSLYYLDRQVGELVRRLDDLGLGANTILLVLSDHGESLGEHGLWSHEFSMYHNLLQVPLLVRYPPRVPPQTVVQAPFTLKDLPELVLDLVRDQAPRAFRQPALPAETPVLAERDRPVNLIRLFKERFPTYDLQRLKRDQKSVIRYPYHLIWDSKSQDELYRLDQDPGELHNLAGQEMKIHREMVNLIADFRREHARPTGPASEPPAMDPETAARLRALGYLK